MDLRQFEFDYDLTWYVFFLNADGAIYGRYGGRDARDAEAKLSLKGLRYAMERALESHQNPPGGEKLQGKPLRAENFPAAKKHSGCIHCHNVKEFARADQQARGTWDRNSVWVYPLPENLGLTLGNTVGNRVEKVQPDSLATRAGILPGAMLDTLNGYRISSFADASYALHKSPWQGNIAVKWSVAEKKQQEVIALPEGWKKTNLTWRPSMLDLLPSLPFSGEELGKQEKLKLGLAPEKAAFRQETPVHPSLASSNLKPGDVVMGFDGVTVTGEMGDLLGFARRNHLRGDTLKIQILRGTKPMELPLLLK